jgi:hypothetical protein
LKERITFMLCTAADGSKCPGFVVGTAKHPKCFDLSPTIPMGYTHQKCAWFDKTVMLYWLNNVLMPCHAVVAAAQGHPGAGSHSGQLSGAQGHRQVD